VGDRTERLATLAAFLEKLPMKLFCFEWGVPKLPTKKRQFGCPLGWATTIPELKKAGLGTRRGVENEILMSYKEHLGLEAVQEFFGLSFDEAWETFTPDGYRLLREQGQLSPQVVASRLRLLITKPKEDLAP
jgi:hypothetical protein